MKFIVMIAACLLPALAVALSAQAQDVLAGRKISGSFYHPYEARAYQHNAVNQSRVLQYYSQSFKTVPAETALKLAGEIKYQVTAAQAEMDKLAGEIKHDRETVKLIQEIQTHHAGAVKECRRLEAECTEHPMGVVNQPGCCDRMVEELNAAVKGHDKLMIRLKLTAPTPAAGNQ
jgi:hypothetical protein